MNLFSKQAFARNNKGFFGSKAPLTPSFREDFPLFSKTLVSHHELFLMVTKK